MESFDLEGIFPEDPRVETPERSLQRISSGNPLGFVGGSPKDFLRELAELTGLSLEEVQALERDGSLDRLLSAGYYSASLLALKELVSAMREGELSAGELLKATVELPKVAQRLAGRDISKHLILNEDRLLELLQPEPSTAEGSVGSSNMDFPEEVQEEEES